MYQTLFCLEILSIFLVYAVADYAFDTTKTSDTSDSIKNSDLIDTSTFCDGSEWIAYKDEKCFKLIKKLKTHKEAEDICKEEWLRTDLYTPRLVSIKSATEQEYLTNFVFNTSEVEVDVWIGARRLPENGNEFIWNDVSVIDFINWGEGSPTKEIGRGCVKIQSRFTRKFSNISYSNLRGINGKWRDVTCESGNFFICQKLQAWSFPKLQQTFLDARKELKDSLENVTKQLDDTKNQLEDTKNQLNDTRNQLDDTRNQLSDIRDKVSASAPAGAIVFFTSNTAPTGWLKANGSEVSRSMYADLFAAIGTTFGSGDGDITFNLPDLRGEFIRGWSHGREVDKGRAFGSFQWGSDIPMAGYVGGNTCLLFQMLPRTVGCLRGIPLMTAWKEMFLLAKLEAERLFLKVKFIVLKQVAWNWISRHGMFGKGPALAMLPS